MMELVNTVGYRLMYATGVTPWDGQPVPDEVVGLVDGPAALAPGRALDLGCGTGADALFLAQHGWKVTGVDMVPKALRRARQRAQQVGAEIEWLHGDVAALANAGVTGTYELALDAGCFHGLRPDARDRYAEGLTAVTAPGATLLMFAFTPGRRGPAPAGADAAELAERFAPDWKLVDTHRDDRPLIGPLRNAAPHWYRLQRR